MLTIKELIMKKSNIKIFIALCIGTLLLSCKKYGYDFQDGHQDGDQDPSAIDTTMFVADKSLYDRARVFPGLVGENVPRIKDTAIIIDMNKNVISSRDYKINVAPQAIYSTGLYAPPGENVKITVPDGLIGLTVQIGAHMDNLTGKETLKRDPVIYTVKELAPGVNYVRNLYGGTIWVRSNVARPNPVNLKFSGPVRASDFVHGQSDIAAWKKDVLANNVPWLEIRGKHMVMTVPRANVVTFINQGRFNDLNEVMAEWNVVYEKDYYDWMGLSATAAEVKNRYPEFPQRVVLDIQPSLGYAHSGFPWVAQNDLQWLDELTNLTTIHNGNSWGSYHEVGHNFQQTSTWSWSDLGETSNNLFIFNGGHRRGNATILNFHPALKTAIPTALTFAASLTGKNFSNLDGVIADGEAPFFRLTPFLQLFDKIQGKNGESGWAFMTYLYNKSRNSDYQFSLDQAKRDYFYRSLCEFTGRDYYRFMVAWGMAVSNVAKKEMRAKYPPMEMTTWTYDPINKTGGNSTMNPKYDLPSSSFEYTSNMATATNESTGKFTAINDGSITTYWHTCYSSCNPVTSLPVTITIDMKTAGEIRGFFIQNRQGNTYATRVKVYTSTDNISWTQQGDYKLAQSSEATAQRNARRDFYFPALVEPRYVKFEFPDKNLGGENHVALAELGVFFDIN